MKAGFDALVGEMARKAAEIDRGLRPDIGVQRGRRKPLIFAILRHNLVAERYEHPGSFLGDDLARHGARGRD